jgi:hypothetical protein
MLCGMPPKPNSSPSIQSPPRSTENDIVSTAEYPSAMFVMPEPKEKERAEKLSLAASA